MHWRQHASVVVTATRSLWLKSEGATVLWLKSEAAAATAGPEEVLSTEAFEGPKTVADVYHERGS